MKHARWKERNLILAVSDREEVVVVVAVVVVAIAVEGDGTNDR